MATGDANDIRGRLRELLPNGWFGSATPVLDAVLSGTAAALSGAYSLAAFARLQTRIATATDGFLDLVSQDFFGGSLPRRRAEPDAAFRTRILAELLAEKGTRRGMVRALTALTGRAPVIFEPARPQDAGGYNVGGCGYGVAGGYGSTRLPTQAFLIAYRPLGQGIPNLGGYGSGTGGYTAGGQLAYASLSQVQGAVIDSDIFRTVDAYKEAGTTVWVQIQS